VITQKPGEQCHEVEGKKQVIKKGMKSIKFSYDVQWRVSYVDFFLKFRHQNFLMSPGIFVLSNHKVAVLDQSGKRGGFIFPDCKL